MKTILVLTAGLLLAVTAFSASAQTTSKQDNGLSWTFVGISGSSQAPTDDTDNSIASAALEGSIGIGDYVILRGNVMDQPEQNGIEQSSVTGGLGLHFPISHSFELFGVANISSGTLKQDDTCYRNTTNTYTDIYGNVYTYTNTTPYSCTQKYHYMGYGVVGGARYRANSVFG